MTAIPPVGDQNPSAEMLLTGALLWATPAQSAHALAGVEDDDLVDPYLRDIVGVVRVLAKSGKSGAAAVADILLARGSLAGERGRLLAKRLADATTCGAEPLCLREYVTSVVAQAYRRRFAALSDGLGGSRELPERDLLDYLRGHGRLIADHAERLARLRGGELL